MYFRDIRIWNEAPFLRLLPPFMGGIIIEWYTGLPVQCAWIFIFIFIGILIAFSVVPIIHQFNSYWLNGICINGLLFSCGILFAFYKDGTHHPRWISNYYAGKGSIVVCIEEPLIEKPGSFKAIASAKFLRDSGLWKEVNGNIILYFKKGKLKPAIKYGSQLIIYSVLQPIRNSGNPGCFDYIRYCSFQHIYYQAFVRSEDFVILQQENINWFKNFLFSTRLKVISILRKFIEGKKESGLAEALLIGYRDDLDRELVQLYSNTGVVHVIAISGLHLGLIYWLLTFLLKPMVRSRFVKMSLVITGLWLFSFLAGASPSVLRSAVMFTCIVIGESISRKNSIYNNLAASAFLLICYDPYWIWDVGFQLSYAAVLSLAIFMKPFYDLCFINNKLLEAGWKLSAVTLAAQVLTLPLCLFHFHQFPVFFIITNFVAVPLSSVILFGELTLCASSFAPFVSKILGSVLQKLIFWMNTFIEYIATYPFSVVDAIQIDITQTMISYIIIGASAYSFLKKRRIGLQISLFALLFFLILREWSFRHAYQQKRIIVYNIPKHKAIDIAYGRNYISIQDSSLSSNDLLEQFHTKPSRVQMRLSKRETFKNNIVYPLIIKFYGKKIVIVESPVPNYKRKFAVDLLIISGNPNLLISNIERSFSCKLLVFDSSNTPWKIKKWKHECQKSGLPCYSVADSGAFVMNMD